MFVYNRCRCTKPFKRTLINPWRILWNYRNFIEAWTHISPAYSSATALLKKVSELYAADATSKRRPLFLIDIEPSKLRDDSTAKSPATGNLVAGRIRAE